MNSHSKTSTFSAPVVQSRLEHHHQQQLKQPEGRHLPHHQRSKSLNKGKRGSSHNNYHQKTKETTNFPTSPTTISSTEFPRKNFSNYSNNFDSSYLKNNDFGLNNNNNNLVENASVGQLQRKISAPSRPQRRHQHSDSVDEDKFRVTPTISILKRPQSATDFVKTNPNSKSTFPLDVTQEEQGFGFHNHRSNKVGEKSPPQQRRSQSKERRRSDVTPSRTKHAQRKEVKSMEFDTNLTFGVNSGSGDESDVNSNNKYVKSVSSLQSSTAVMFPPLNYDNAIIALEEGMSSNRKDMLYSNSDDNATIKSFLKKRSEQYIESTPRRRSSTAIELQSQLSRFADSDSIPLSSESLLSSTPPSARRPSSSPSRLGGGPKLYAGPTFHNSPAPSDLPMPSFYGKSFGKEPSPLSVGNNLFTVLENTPSYDAYSSPSSGNTSDDDMFSMDDLEPPKAPYYSGTPTLRKQKSQELLRILSTANTRQHQTASAYMVPERMATAHNPMQVYPANLNEISETLRSLLKIHGQ
jgi:hypothetical protein